MAQVLATLYKLSGVATKNGYTGPAIGVKIADQNIRDHDEQKLREGRNIIGLQVRSEIITCFSCFSCLRPR